MSGILDGRRPTVVPVVTRERTEPMLKGLQVGFNASSIAGVLPLVRDLGVQLVRIDLQHATTPAQIEALVREVQNAGMQELATVQAHQLEWLPFGSWCELLNEPDLEGPPARDYVRWMLPAAEQARHRKLRLYVGVVSNLNKRGFDYLSGIMPHVPADLGVMVHRYPNGAQTIPHDGFKSREQEVHKLLGMIGDRPYAVSEFGYHTAGGLNDAQATADIQAEFAFWDRMAAVFAVLYQINDGPGTSTLDRYGIRTLDGVWKPQAGVFA